MPSDREVFDWIESRYGNLMGARLLGLHRRLLIDHDHTGFVPADLVKVIQTVNHARACIRAGHEPLAG